MHHGPLLGRGEERGRGARGRVRGEAEEAESMRTLTAAAGRWASRWAAQKAAPWLPVALEAGTGLVPTARTRAAAGKQRRAQAMARPVLTAPWWWATMRRVGSPGA